MSGKIGRLVRGLVQAQQELHHQQKLQEEEVDVEEVVVEPGWDLSLLPEKIIIDEGSWQIMKQIEDNFPISHDCLRYDLLLKRFVNL